MPWSVASITLSVGLAASPKATPAAGAVGICAQLIPPLFEA
jgi:hypothetical protein